MIWQRIRRNPNTVLSQTSREKMFPFSSRTPNKQRSHLHTSAYIRIKVPQHCFISLVLQTLTAKPATPRCVRDRKPFKTKLFKLAAGNSYSEQSFLLYPIREEDFYTYFLSLQARDSTWTVSAPAQRSFTCSWTQGSMCNKCELQYMHQFMLIRGKYRCGKKGTLAYTSHSFYKVPLKKKYIFFFFFFFSANSPLVLQAGNHVGK